MSPKSVPALIRIGRAAEELDLQVGDEAVCVVKATNVVVEVPARGGQGAR